MGLIFQNSSGSCTEFSNMKYVSVISIIYKDRQIVDA